MDQTYLQFESKTRWTFFMSLSCVIAVACAVVGAMTVLHDELINGWVIISGGIVICLAALFAYVRRDWYKISAVIFLAVCFLLMFVTFVYGGVEGSGIVWMPYLALAGFFLLNRLAGVVMAGGMIAMFASSYYFLSFFGIQPYFSFEQSEQLFIAVLVVTFVVFVHEYIVDQRLVRLKEVEDLANKKNKELMGALDLQAQTGVELKISAETVNKQKEDLENTRRAMLNLLEDIDGEKEVLKKITDRFTMATQAARLGLWEQNLDTGETVWSDEMYLLYGLKKNSVKNIVSVWQKYIHPDDVARRQVIIDEVMQSKKNAQYDFRIIRADGQVRDLRAFLTFVSKTAGSKGGLVGICWDITKEKEVDRQKTEFVSLASHQLRTPLTAIKLFSEMLASKDVGKLNATQKDYVESVQESTKRMITLVNDLLNVSRLETGRLKITPVPTDFVALIKDAIKEVEPWAKAKNCAIIFKSPTSEFDKVSLDQALMREVITNFLSNAIRYAGKVKPKVVVKLEKNKKELVLGVEDNGIGIPKEVQPRIFQKFFRADNAIKQVADGSGLGLYVVKMIMESGGGRVWFASEGGKGTIFYAAIPLSGMKEKAGEKGLAS